MQRDKVLNALQGSTCALTVPELVRLTGVSPSWVFRVATRAYELVGWVGENPMRFFWKKRATD